MLVGYHGDRFISYEHHLDLYYDRTTLYLHTKGLTIDHNQMPEYLVIAKIEPKGSLTWSDEFEVKLSYRTYRYKLSDRLVALIWGVWVKNADYPEFRLNYKDSSLTMIDLPSE
ncbi:MAG: hypothetical protein HRU09_11045 [Oligoflexales bacterium]|nr:hypothetical protein [Oligoflexales bacterium]